MQSYFFLKVLGGSRESLSGTRRKGCINYIPGTDIDEGRGRRGKERRARAREIDVVRGKVKFSAFSPEFLLLCVCLFVLSREGEMYKVNDSIPHSRKKTCLLT